MSTARPETCGRTETAAPAPSPLSTRLQAVWHARRMHVFGIDAEPAIPRAVSLSTLSAARLHEALGTLSADALLATSAAESVLQLALPAIKATPDSSALNPEARANLSATCLVLGPADAVDLFAGLELNPSTELGDSFRFWRALARYVVGCIARQKFCPDVFEIEQDRFVGRWRLLIHDRAELLWLERAIALMPPICRAVAPADGPSPRPTEIVESFLAEASDALIRRSLAGDEFFTQIGDRAKQQGSWTLHWLTALIGDDCIIRADADECASGMARVRSWITQADQDQGPSPVLRFILQEPVEATRPSEPAWRLALEMRAGDTGEPLDLAQVWSEPSDAPTILGSHLLSRRQQLVGLLTRAADVFPEARRAMSRGGSGAVRLTTAEAYNFIRERAPLLDAEGFDVVLPEWARLSDRPLGLRLSVSPHRRAGDASDSGISRLGLSSLVDFDWRIAVGDEQLTLEEFEQVVRHKAPLVKLRGQWVGLDQEAARKAVAFLKSQRAGPMTLMQAVRVVGGAEDVDSGLPITGLTGSDWLASLLGDTPDAQIDAFDPPDAFRGTLRPYQLRGLHWLAFLDRVGIGACLADDMGLGKTIQLLALLLHERSGGAAAGPTLLFAPMSVVGNWEREIQKFAPSLRVLVHHGPLRLTGEAFIEAADRSDVVITTYGLAGRSIKDLSRVAWHRIALDEAQKIKNPTAQQTVALRSLAAPRKVALTGTPIENRLSELWSIMDVLNPGILGGAAQFRGRFAVPIEKSGDARRADQLRRLVRPFVLRRSKSDPAIARDLPEKMEMRVYCNLTAEQAALYEQTVADTLKRVEAATGIRRRGLILAALTRLKQVCNHPLHLLKQDGPLDDRSGKCERLIEMLEEVIEEGDCALVFTQYREMGTLLQRLMQDRLRMEIAFLHGGTPMKKRQKMIDAFQDDSAGRRIFLLSLKAGGFGLNLTRANHVFHFDRWWNPAVEEQAADRVHRIGQTRRVQIHKFVCVGTVEERIDRLLTEKSALADRIVGSGDEWLTNLSTAELREYLKLSDDAVSES